MHTDTLGSARIFSEIPGPPAPARCPVPPGTGRAHNSRGRARQWWHRPGRTRRRYRSCATTGSVPRAPALLTDRRRRSSYSVAAAGAGPRPISPTGRVRRGRAVPDGNVTLRRTGQARGTARRGEEPAGLVRAVRTRKEGAGRRADGAGRTLVQHAP